MQLGLQTVTYYGHKHIKAWHTNTPVPAGPPSLFKHPLIYLSMFLLPFRQKEQENMKIVQAFSINGDAYSKLQMTKPQTLAYGLTDSPAGLLAWIYEKLVAWSDKYPWTDDEGRSFAVMRSLRIRLIISKVIEWVSIYWFSRAGPGAAGRIYHELNNGGSGSYFDGAVWQSVPLGVSYFPGEIFPVPKS